MMKMTLLLAVFLVALPAAFCAEALYSCAGTTSTRSVTFTYTGPNTETFTSFWIEGAAFGDAGCEQVVTASGTSDQTASLTVDIGNCEIPDFIPNTAGTSSGNILLTIAQNIFSDATDIRYSWSCAYNDDNSPDTSTEISGALTPTIDKPPVAADKSISATVHVYKNDDAAFGILTECTVGDSSFNLNLFVEVINEQSSFTDVVIDKITTRKKDDPSTDLVILENGCSNQKGAMIGIPINTQSVASTVATETFDSATTVNVRRTYLDGDGFRCFVRRGLNDVVNEFTLLVKLCAGVDCRPTCTTGRRRRAVNDEFGVIMKNVTFRLEAIDPEVNTGGDKTATCVGYTSNAVFFSVITVLAVLLVITIGVAAFFGSRARTVIQHERFGGKDANPVYG